MPGMNGWQFFWSLPVIPQLLRILTLTGVATEWRRRVPVGGDLNLFPSASTHRLPERKCR